MKVGVILSSVQCCVDRLFSFYPDGAPMIKGVLRRSLLRWQASHIVSWIFIDLNWFIHLRAIYTYYILRTVQGTGEHRGEQD